jgi:hypothetical protein
MHGLVILILKLTHVTEWTNSSYQHALYHYKRVHALNMYYMTTQKLYLI